MSARFGIETNPVCLGSGITSLLSPRSVAAVGTFREEKRLPCAGYGINTRLTENLARDDPQQASIKKQIDKKFYRLIVSIK